jgi:hypothetical protein
MQFIFIKPDLRMNGGYGSANYAGGQHGYMCAARSLAAAGHKVDLLYTSTKSELMFSLLQQGCMGSLAYSTAVEGVAVWSAHGLTHHASLSDAQVQYWRSPQHSSNVPMQPGSMQRLSMDLQPSGSSRKLCNVRI